MGGKSCGVFRIIVSGSLSGSGVQGEKSAWFERVTRCVVVGQVRSVAQGRRMRSVGRTQLKSDIKECRYADLTKEIDGNVFLSNAFGFWESGLMTS